MTNKNSQEIIGHSHEGVPDFFDAAGRLSEARVGADFRPDAKAFVKEKRLANICSVCYNALG